jgi:hypothetical protein
MVLLSLLAACADPDGKDAADPEDSAAPPRTCPAPSIALQNDFTQDLLPTTYDAAHTLQGVGLGDLDGDGWLDALFAYGGGAAGFRNDGTGNLVLDPTIDADGGPMPSGQAVALADLDGDGDLDAYLGRDRGWSGVILTNDGTGHFTSVELPDSAQAAMTGAFADFDGDGDLDLYTGATITDTDGQGVIDGTITAGDGDRLFIRGDDGLYTNETDARIPADSSWGWTFQGAPIDYDGDGDLDLYLAHDWGAYIMPNRLLRNDGTGHFTRVEDCFCELVMYDMSAAVGDANGDALPDLYLTDIGGPNLLVNLGDGTFADATAALGASIPSTDESLTSWGSSFVDLDQDSWTDVAVTFGQLGQPDLVDDVIGSEDWVDGAVQYDVMVMGDGSGHYGLPDLGWADGERKRAVAVGDLDRDGDPDLVTVGKYFLRQWRTDGGCAPGVRVLLHGKGLNPQAIGARVQVTLGDRVVTQWALPSTTGSSNAPELYFGLGPASALDAVTVTWPDGSTSESGRASLGETVDLYWE